MMSRCHEDDLHIVWVMILKSIEGLLQTLEEDEVGHDLVQAVVEHRWSLGWGRW